ncbi:hypothetical protein KDW_41040 [Dictyobacter vulcani]|uniref:Carrier domain-containing protein n=1 Tax=Dictyobacter vulcani TaxID=2607529 RepID=A0A5J4KS65_9CHLR|nr:hypothetical protein KDW_41040 [Dictyobacter vulcani]
MNAGENQPVVSLPLVVANVKAFPSVVDELSVVAEVKEKPTRIALRPLDDEQIFSNVYLEEAQMVQIAATSTVPPVPASVSREVLQEDLRASLAEVLYMDQHDVAVDEAFVDIGMDSITGLEWIKTINKHYGTSIAVTKVYDYPTIQHFADYLSRELGKQRAEHPVVSIKIKPAGTTSSLAPMPVVLEKPTRIALRSLDDESVPSRKHGEEIQVSLTAHGEEAQTVQIAATSTVPPVPASVSREVLQEDLRASLAEVLYMDQHDVAVDEAFVDIGMDSITGLEWIKTINKHYGTSIAVTKVYDYPTIQDFADYLSRELGKQRAEHPVVSVAIKPAGAVKSSRAVQQLAVEQPMKAESSAAADPILPAVQQSSSAEQAGQVKQPVRKEEIASSTAIPQGRDGIAIVGMSGRYPGAPDLNQYWDNLAHARTSVREIPKSRWDVNRYYDPRLHQKGKIYCKSMGVLEDIERFDPLFFNISPSEAEVMDPQHRIFLQEGYKAFEDAGYNYRSLSNKKCGVYLGIMNNEYAVMLHQNQVNTSATGNSFSIAAARIPYYLNLKGPAIAIDTACSSSLVGTHLACQALLNQEIDMALVGGITLYLTPDSYMSMCTAGMLSPDGQCKTFDNSANGFVPGEGAGAVILKRLKDAEADGDHIYGVIIGSGINQDGRTNGITAPSVNSQMELEREVYEKYNIQPQSIGYVEMHGTGTKQGDPVELEALATVFKKKTSKKNYCAIGSVKSNIGHTSAAAGIAGLQKVLLCMQHEKLVPTLHFKTPNEHFNFADSPFYVNTEFKQWDAIPGMPRRACLSSFGYSGTNAHMVLEEYLPGKCISGEASVRKDVAQPVLFVLSARKKEQLKAYVQEMKSFIEAHRDLNLMDMAYTLQIGREAMDYRMAFVADSREKLLQGLDDYVKGSSAAGIFSAQVKESKGEVRVFETDDDAKSLLQTWIEKKKSKNIAELWVKGLPIDWTRLYGEDRPRRISLPTYPFARDTYWLPDAPPPAPDRPPRPAAHDEDTASRVTRLLTKQWELCPAVPREGTAQTRTVALLTTTETASLAAAVAALMPHAELVDVTCLDHPDRSARAGDWTRLDGVIDLVGCGYEPERGSGWLVWLQQLITQGEKGRLLLLGVTRGLESFGSTTSNLTGATRAGLYRMLSHEYHQLRARHMDGDASRPEAELAAQIVAEFCAESDALEVCYRAGQRYRAHLVPSPDLIADRPSAPVAFPAEHVLLITGGTRGLGALCAQHMVRHYGVKRLVLTGREPWPERAQWKQVGQQDSALAAKIRLVQRLEAEGVQVQVLALRLSDATAVQQSLDAIHSTLGPIGACSTVPG